MNVMFVSLEGVTRVEDLGDYTAVDLPAVFSVPGTGAVATYVRRAAVHCSDPRKAEAVIYEQVIRQKEKGHGRAKQ